MQHSAYAYSCQREARGCGGYGEGHGYQYSSYAISGTVTGLSGTLVLRCRRRAAKAPGARVTASAWTDSSGDLWLFGGYGYGQSGNADDLSDLWEYNPTSAEWTWVSGSSNAAATGNYGMLGSAAGTNLPGAREQSASWSDGHGNLWLFGGFGYDSLGELDDLNDLWSFTP